jgi:hypothetical protein
VVRQQREADRHRVVAVRAQAGDQHEIALGLGHLLALVTDHAGVHEDAVGSPLPQGLLAEITEAWQRGADELTSRDEEIAEYVEALKNERDTSELPEASGDAIAKEFERYLRRRNVDPE